MDGTPKSQWEYIYQTIPTNQIPWENGEPSPDLVLLFKEKVIRKGMKVLDVGCGLGTQTRFIAKQGAVPTGIDISETAIKKAREHMLRGGLPAPSDAWSTGPLRPPSREAGSEASEAGVVANFIVGDVCKMAFPNGSFECIYDRGCYHHLSSRQRYYYAKEVSRVLTPSGLLHMLIFARTMRPREVVEYFLPNFSVLGAREDTVLDHTNGEQLAIHIVQFKKKG